jgi:hypothetical protein
MALEIAAGSYSRKELGRLAPDPTVGPNRISEQTMTAENDFFLVTLPTPPLFD